MAPASKRRKVEEHTSFQSSLKKPYTGERMSMVISMDVGTTYSGVAFAILRPGELPEVQEVTRFPDQTGTDRKVPSVLYYDASGKVQACGATTLIREVIMNAYEEEWFKSEHFKLHLRPGQITTETNGFKICPLPPGKSAEDVFGDFLTYLFQSTIDFIKERVNGPLIWDACKDSVHFVLTHPNSWEGSQLQTMRRSAVCAGMIRDVERDRSRLTFVSEGEASLHWCLSKAQSDVKIGDSFIIVDAGGGTMDTNSYEIQSLSPVRVQEIAVPDCRFAGSIFVNRRALAKVQERLQGSVYNIKRLPDFDTTTKRAFKDDSRIQWVSIGKEETVTVPELGIRNGMLKMDGKEVADCFKLSVDESVASIRMQQKLSQKDNMAVWLVGGFSGSPWLLHQLKLQLEPAGHKIYRPDPNTSKAVAEGGLIYFLDRLVTSRICKVSAGTTYSLVYDARNPEHQCRPRFTHPDGQTVVGEVFHCFIAIGTKVTSTEVRTKEFFRQVRMPGHAIFDQHILRYTGPLPVPGWADKNPEHFELLCVIKTDLSSLCTASTKRSSPNGKPYHELHFEIEVKFGLTEFEALVKWTEGGTEKSTPAVVIFEDKVKVDV